jgi:hypothetical protein
VGRWWRRDRLKTIPTCPGVYAIYIQNRLYYIGQSQNMRDRMVRHGIRDAESGNIHAGLVIDGKRWRACHVFIKTRSVKRLGDWLRLEYILIRRLKPPGNSAGTMPMAVVRRAVRGSFVRPTTLKSKLLQIIGEESRRG